ncbi:MAG TPA: hypothetical protein VEC19_02550 [Usitatibacter sp.]|nr:hypothetical protein [Usitatibacter sp.]
MRHRVSKVAAVVSAAYLAFAVVLLNAGPAAFGLLFLGLPWTAIIGEGMSDITVNSLLAASIIVNAAILYLLTAAFVQFTAKTFRGARDT